MKKIMFNDRYGLTEAVLSGQKTQTRRIVPKSFFSTIHDIEDNNTLVFEDAFGDWHDIRESRYALEVGEIVAVAQSYKDAGVLFLPEEDDEFGCHDFPADQTNGWANKMFVRADLMHHQIRITNVRVERLQDISDEDCIKEGIVRWTKDRELFKYDLSDRFEMFEWRDMPRTPHEAYAALIDRISGKGTWDSNPFVFVYDFELVK
ncbi:MAG: hypothetical protein HDR46_01120 [Bacteroides sp.]|nr:hypothetical protein [Bacteroides sp.]